MTPPDRDTLRRLVAGRLEDDARAAVEERVLTDEPTFEAALDAEDALVEGYLAGTLSVEEARSVEERLAVSGRLRAHLELARALGERARTARVGPTPTARFSGVAWLGMAAAALLALSLQLWLGGRSLQRQVASLQAERDTLRAGEQRQEAARNEDRERIGELTRKLEESAANRPLPLLALGIASSLRSRQQLPRIVLPAGAESVRLEADVEGTGVFDSFRGTVETAAGSRVWSLAPLESRDKDGFVTLGATLPSRALPPGSYVLEIEGLRRGRYEPAGSLEFAVGASRP